MTGRITARDDEYVTMEAEVSGRKFSRRYPVRSIRAATLDGRRIVLGLRKPVHLNRVPGRQRQASRGPARKSIG